MMSRYRKGGLNLKQNPKCNMPATPERGRMSRKVCSGMALTAMFLMVAFVWTSDSTSTDENIPDDNADWVNDKVKHKALTLSREQTQSLVEQVNVDSLWSYLIPMLIPRPPGSENIKSVAKHIVKSLKTMGSWQIERDTFLDTPPPPYTTIEFSNIIANMNPDATRKLVFACHYDSKILSESEFVAATDSAVPCAMLLEIARVLSNALKQHTDKQHQLSQSTPDVGLELLFLDGEEAFVEWTATDSLFGARHLASKWKNETWKGSNRLASIDLFTLLHLIGGPTAAFYNFRSTYSRWFKHAGDIEKRLKARGLINRTHQQIFPKEHLYEGSNIQDDHIPFLAEGIPIMHLITVPFPDVWHTLADDESALDRERTLIITKILTIFVAEYLHLSPFI